MLKSSGWAFTVVIILAGAVGFAQADAPAAYQSCIACHGAAGQGNQALAAPALAGQQAAYLERQLYNFQTGIRGSDAADTAGAQMRAMSATLSSADIPAVAAYLAGLPAPVFSPSPQADLNNGNNYYQSKCGACHGGKAQGNAGLNAPALANLDANYLERQFENFQRGLRGAHPDDKFGRQMKMMASSLPTQKDLTDVIAFIHAQSAPRSASPSTGQ